MADEKYPDGQLNAHEGQMQMRLVAFRGRVIVDFGKPVQWIGFDREGLTAFIAGLQKTLAEAEREQVP